MVFNACHIKIQPIKQQRVEAWIQHSLLRPLGDRRLVMVLYRMLYDVLIIFPF